ncbi:MAG: hypothetical protein KDD82_04310 [Planctomycetes bacterium]|nr:hypothetical protein [Planctomycetota bacterium]
MSESRYDDATLAAYLEGLLPEGEAAELVLAAQADPDLAARLALAERMLEEPVLGPVAPPAQLEAWLRSEVEQAATTLAEEGADEPDLLAGGLDLEQVEAAARRVAEEVFAKVGGSTGTFDPGSSGTSFDPNSSSSNLRSTGVFDKKFLALAREVKSLKEQVEKPAAPSGDVVGLLATVEFKQAFDTKINQVLGYVKSDVVPRAVKKALEEQQS